MAESQIQVMTPLRGAERTAGLEGTKLAAYHKKEGMS